MSTSGRTVLDSWTPGLLGSWTLGLHRGADIACELCRGRTARKCVRMTTLTLAGHAVYGFGSPSAH